MTRLSLEFEHVAGGEVHCFVADHSDGQSRYLKLSSQPGLTGLVRWVADRNEADYVPVSEEISELSRLAFYLSNWARSSPPRTAMLDQSQNTYNDDQTHIPRNARIVIEAVCHYYGIDEEAMLGPRRMQYTTHARHVAVYLLRNLLRLSWPEIGDCLNRDHTTAMSAYEKIANEIAGDASQLAARTKDEVEGIRLQLQSKLTPRPESG